MKTIVRYLLMLPLIAVVSCLREQFNENIPCPCEEEKEVTFKLALPYVAPNAVTRAIDAADENYIEALDILVFKVNNNNETFDYLLSGKKVAVNNDGASMQSFTSKVRVQSYSQRFVLIANAREELKELIATRGDGWVGQDKENLLGKLDIELKGGRWTTDKNDPNYRSIPMWGQTVAETISGTNTAISNDTIKMLRMVAKIEVQVDKSVSGLASKFELKSVRLYNTINKGRVAPKSDPIYIGANMIAKKASLPDNAVNNRGPIEYTDFNSPGEVGVAMKGAIYLFETAAKNANSRSKETCIVIGGNYLGKETYYRIDFLAPDGKTHLDILRNHAYKCNITAVNGPGCATADDAFNSKSSNMAVDIIVWDVSEIHDIVFNNQYMLGVNKNPFILSSQATNSSGTNNILKIYTDYPGGWNAQVSTNSTSINVPQNSWISIDALSGVGGGTQLNNVHIILKENMDTQNRTAYIHINAGNLKYVVTVIQTQKIRLQGTVTVTPSRIYLPYTITKIDKFVNVSCEYPDGSPADLMGWTLTLQNAPSWCKLSLSATGANPTTSVSGIGNTKVYIVAESNQSPLPRSATIIEETSEEDATTIIQWGNVGGITDAGTLPIGPAYVGAFWRTNQTGERVIKVRLNTSERGAWTATVMWQDERWGNDDGVILSAEESKDNKIYTSDAGDAELFPVKGNATEVAGTNTGEYIMFRIGLKTKYTPTADFPARYAVVLLSYNNNTKFYKIFLRQGDDADWLMKKNDLIYRPQSVKFSPYNLTAKKLDAIVDISGVPAGNPGKFTDYPSQAGAFFQWANNYNGSQFSGGNRWAFSPHKNCQPWNGNAETTDCWYTLAATHETAPSGFRRPNDGPTSVISTGDTNSELRQSLFSNPSGTGFNYENSIENSVWGYYADGFFDRRQITNGCVSAGNSDVAYIGRLFFNPVSSSDHYNASLFFPATGTLHYYNGALVRQGEEGMYWTSSNVTVTLANGLNRSAALRIWTEHAGPWSAEKGTAMPIRCVEK